MSFDSFYLCTIWKSISRPSSEFEQRRNPMAKTLTGKVALVTGGSRGIRAASAPALAHEGAHVALSHVAPSHKAEAGGCALQNPGGPAPALPAQQAQEAPGGP